jgi:putative flavoprotein involved in K+ transport
MSEWDVLVIGAGQAGLAAAYYLEQQHITYRVLEAGERIGHQWRARYEGLRLLTPARYCSLPGMPFPAPPYAFPTKDEVADYLERYARRFRLRVLTGQRVLRMRRGAEDSFEVITEQQSWSARNVIVATGAYAVPRVPEWASDLDPELWQIHSQTYRNPDQVPGEPVLVVGGGNSGIAIAEELSRTRLVYWSCDRPLWQAPERIFGIPVHWWAWTLGLNRMSVHAWPGRWLRRLNEPVSGVNLKELLARPTLRLVSRVVGVRDGGRAIELADGRLLSGIQALIWATGYRICFPWIELPVFDASGQPQHLRGVSVEPGLYFLGLPWLHSRGSALIGGVGRDARYVVEHIRRYRLRSGSSGRFWSGAIAPLRSLFRMATAG